MVSGWWLGILGIVGVSSTICNQPLDMDSVVGGDVTCRPVGVIESTLSSIPRFCFQDGSLTNNSLVVNVNRTSLVQRMEFTSIPGDTIKTSFPDRIRVSSFLDSSPSEIVWFKNSSDAASSAVWSQISVSNNVADLSFNGLEFNHLTVYPHSDQQRQLRFEIRLLGCPLDSTRTVTYVFKSTSREVIEMRFGSLSLFQRRLLAIVETETQVDTKRLHPHLSIADAVIIVELIILPDTQAGAQSVDEISGLLSSTDSLKTKLAELERMVVDVAVELCLNKQCPAGTVCLHGKCATRESGLTGPAPGAVTPDNTANMRRIIATAPQVSGRSYTATLGRKEIAFIAIGAGTVIAVIIIALLRVYMRMKRHRGQIE
jgi:hypothetical protein